MVPSHDVAASGMSGAPCTSIRPAHGCQLVAGEPGGPLQDTSSISKLDSETHNSIYKLNLRCNAFEKKLDELTNTIDSFWQGITAQKQMMSEYSRRIDEANTQIPTFQSCLPAAISEMSSLILQNTDNLQSTLVNSVLPQMQQATIKVMTDACMLLERRIILLETSFCPVPSLDDFVAEAERTTEKTRTILDKVGEKRSHRHSDPSSLILPPPCTVLPIGRPDCFLNYRDMACAKATCTQGKGAVNNLLHGDDAAPDDDDDPFDAGQYERAEDCADEFFEHAPRRLGDGACCSTNLAVNGAFEPGCNCVRQSASATVALDTT